MAAQQIKAKTLVQAWLEVELKINERTLTEALAGLNKHLDSAHTHSRVREWAENRGNRGDRLPRTVRRYMARKAARSILEDAGIATQGMKNRIINTLVERFI